MVNLDKATKAFVVSLQKETDRTGIEHEIVAQVKFTPDISGSMTNLYTSGKVGEVLKRLYPVAVILDDDKEMEVYPFSRVCEEINVKVNEENYENYIKKELLDKEKHWYFGGTSYEAMIKEIMKKANNIPILSLSIVDGETDNKEMAKKAIIESANKAVFFVFFGIGDNKFEFGFLESLDNMKEKRKIDNVAFYYVDDISKISDEELYAMIAEQFVPWFYEAKRLGIF